MGFTQWATNDDGAAYTAAGKTVETLLPGYYDLTLGNGQVFFIPVHARTDELLEFPDSASKDVIDGIVNFWDREKIYAKYDIPFRRGILLYGPPGSGKTSTLQLVSRDVVARGGVVVNYQPTCFLTAYRQFRDVQPETYMVVLMEDFESTIVKYESSILNMLDGVEALDRVVFLASTNYPEKLQERIVNRPSRFDIIMKIPHPGPESRKLYLESLIHDDDSVDVAAYIRDTDGLSLAHLKELFVATVVLGSDYNETVDRLKKMASDPPTSADDYKVSSPFGAMI